ncbi:MAG: O-antigen ligase family protein [Desulfomonilia bacterium]
MILISVLFGELTSNGLIKMKGFIVILIPTVLVSFWVIKNEADLKYLGNGIIALGLFTSAYILSNSIYKSWGNVQYLSCGTMTSLGGLVSIHRFLVEIKKRWFYFLSCCICSIGVIVSYARGQQLIYSLILCSMLTYYFCFIREKIKKKVIVIFCLIILSILILIVYNTKLSLDENFLYRFGENYFEEGLDLRFILFENALTLFRQNPFIPAGIGQYSVEFQGEIIRYPHNIPLEFAAEFGFIGLLYYCLLIMGVFYGYLRFRKNKIIREHLIIYVFLFLISLKQGYIYEDKDFWTWSALGLGFLGWHRVVLDRYGSR